MSRIENATTETNEHEEIEITPEMIEAGVSALDEYLFEADLGPMSRRSAVRDVWVSMYKAAKS